MRLITTACVALLIAAHAAAAQQPDTTRPRTRADSVAKAAADSIALMKELGIGLSPAPSSAPATPPLAQPGPTNGRLLPDISAVGDLLADLSPKASTQENNSRFGVREVELAVQSIVDPYFRGDVFLGFNDREGVAIEQAYLTTTALPNQLEARLGRFLMPFGKQNTTHRHDLHTIEYPYVIQRFFGAEGLKGTGVWGSRVIAPFGFFQEVQLTAIDRLGEATEGLVTREPVNKALGGLGFSARLRNYVDISESQNVELSFSALTGKREQPLDSAVLARSLALFANGVNAVAARQSIFGADLTYRWRPLQQGLYQSFILQGEIMHQRNAQPSTGIACVLPTDCGYAGPTRGFTGAYVFSRYQTGQRTYVGARYDWVQDPTADGRTLTAGSGYLEWYPSEFTKLLASYEAVVPNGGTTSHRLLLQAVFSQGPHKPHPF